jgi:hypothetical protein
MEPTPASSANPWICLRCETVGRPEASGYGAVVGAIVSIIGAVVAGSEAPALGGVAFAIAGVALAAGRGHGRACTKCGAHEVIPVSSPRAQRARAAL